MIYFLQKVEKSKKEKIVALGGQGLDVTYNFRSDKSITGPEPVGTIFYVYGPIKTIGGTGGKTPYYSAGNYICKYDETTAAISVTEAYKNVLAAIAAEAAKEATETDETVEVEAETTEAAPTGPATLLETIVGTKELAAPKAREGFYVSTDDWSILVRNIQRHVNTMIIGPTGSGKTSVVQEICKRMGKKLYIFDMGTMLDPISSLLGVHRLEKGESIFDYAKFTRVIKEPCVILLDELSRAPLTTMNILFSCLDDRRNLNIEIANTSGEREIDVNPEVTFIATANIGAEYSGTNSLDRALVNRFFPVELGCIPSKEEVTVLQARTGIDKDKAELIVKITNNIRSLCTKQEISVSLSIRETLMVAQLISDGWSLGRAMEVIYLPLYEGTKNEGERATVYKTISSY